jgi:hypothetical protein
MSISLVRTSARELRPRDPSRFTQDFARAPRPDTNRPAFGMFLRASPALLALGQTTHWEADV